MNRPNPSLKPFARLHAANFLGALLAIASFAATSLPGNALAEEAEAADPLKSTLDDIWGFATLYESEETFIKKISFIGRYHGQYVDSQTNASLPNNAQFGGRYWNHRRWRSGIKVAMGEDLTFTNTWNLDTSDNFNGPRFFSSIEEMHLEWEPTDDFYLIVGKQKPKITREYTTSSKRILTFERSTIVNNVISDKIWGVTAGFKAAGIDHELGIFANAYDSDYRWLTFDDIDPVATYRGALPICESTDLHFDYQYVDTTYNGGETANVSPYQHVVAIGTESDWGRFDLLVDFIAAYDRAGDTRLLSRDDTVGLVILPSYDLTEKLQFVTKYSYASDARITHPQRRARHTSPGGDFRPAVDNLHTFYAGLNYRIYGDKLKLMAGFEHATAENIVPASANDYTNDTWLFGIRAYW